MSKSGKSTIVKSDEESAADSNQNPEDSNLGEDSSPPSSNDEESSPECDEPNPSSPSKELLSPNRQKRESTSSTGEQSRLEVSPSKKRKQAASLVEQDDSASLDKDDDEEETKSISPDDSTQKCQSPRECPTTPPPADQMPENQSTSPIISEMRAAGRPLLSPIKDLVKPQEPQNAAVGQDMALPLSGAVTTETPQPTSDVHNPPVVATETPQPTSDVHNPPAVATETPQPTSDVSNQHPTLIKMLSHPVQFPNSANAPNELIPIVPKDNPLLRGMLSGTYDSSSYTPADVRSSPDLLSESMREGEASENVQPEEMSDTSERISSHSPSLPLNDPSAQSVIGASSVDTSRTESDSSSQPTSMDIPPETSGVRQTIARRLQKMSESKSASNAPEGDSTVNPDDEVFKKPVTASRLQRMNNRLTDVNLEDSKATDSPNRRSDRIKSKESAASSKESASADKGRSLRPKPGSRTSSDEKLKESEKSKSLSRERFIELKAEGDVPRSASLERSKTKTKAKPSTPSSKSKKDSTLSGSRERMSSDEGVAARTRSNRPSTSSNNSETEKTEDDEKDGAMSKRKSRKDSAK